MTSTSSPTRQHALDQPGTSSASPQQKGSRRPHDENQPPSSSAVEMANLHDANPRSGSTDLNDVQKPSSNLASESSSHLMSSDIKAADDRNVSQTSTDPQYSTAVMPSTGDPHALSDPQSSTAGGTGPIEPVTSEAEGAGPTLMITLLMTSGGRYAHRIDKKYLKKRSINATDNDPFNLSVYTLKELIWRDWRDEWDSRPSSPGSIRLIHFGRLLDDKSPLRECRFNAEAPNVVHMTVRPQEVVDEEDAKTAKQLGRDGEGNQRSPGCRCVIL